MKTPRMPRACPVEIHVGSKDATGLCSIDRESPRGKPVASLGQQLGGCVAATVNLQRDKPVASSEFSHSLFRWWDLGRGAKPFCCLTPDYRDDNFAASNSDFSFPFQSSAN